MSGNVWEWCYDWYGRYPSGLVTDPVGPSSDWSRVIRGCSWDLFADYCRSSHRSFRAPSFGSGLGFRVALVPIE